MRDENDDDDDKNDRRQLYCEIIARFVECSMSVYDANVFINMSVCLCVGGIKGSSIVACAVPSANELGNSGQMMRCCSVIFYNRNYICTTERLVQKTRNMNPYNIRDYIACIHNSAAGQVQAAFAC